MASEGFKLEQDSAAERSRAALALSGAEIRGYDALYQSVETITTVNTSMNSGPQLQGSRTESGRSDFRCQQAVFCFLLFLTHSSLLWVQTDKNNSTTVVLMPMYSLPWLWARSPSTMGSNENLYKRTVLYWSVVWAGNVLRLRSLLQTCWDLLWRGGEAFFAVYVSCDLIYVERTSAIAMIRSSSKQFTRNGYFCHFCTSVS